MSKKKDTQYRNILGAAFNEEHLLFKDWPGVTYGVYGKEICPTTKKEHYQYYLEFNAPKRFNTIKKKFPKLHFECRRGTSLQASDYCKKDGDFEEWGQRSSQGNRIDLQALCTEVRLGKKTIDDILVEMPNAYHQYGRTLQKCEEFYFRSLKRTEMTECIWYHGPTGVGKSHAAYTEHPDAYDYPYDGDWWDGYRNQDTVIINDFRGQIPYDKMLRLVDKWPCSVRVRCSQPRPFTSKLIIITSSKSPAQVYCQRNEEDSLDQLLRRIKVVNLKKRKSNGQ